MDETIPLLQPIQPNASPRGQTISSHFVVLDLQPAPRNYKSVKSEFCNNQSDVLQMAGFLRDLMQIPIGHNQTLSTTNAGGSPNSPNKAQFLNHTRHVGKANRLSTKVRVYTFGRT